MIRKLTDDEVKEVKTYLKSAKNTTFEAIALHFEDRFKTPVTVHCIQRIMIEMYLEKNPER